MYLLCKNEQDFEQHVKRIVGHASENHAVSLHYIFTKTGCPLNGMGNLKLNMEAKASKAWLVDKDLAAFKQYCYAAAKLNILSACNYTLYEFIPFRLSSGNEFTDLFPMLMSDSPALKNFIIRHADKVFPLHSKFSGSDFRPYMTSNIMLALQGQQWDLLKQRCELFLGKVPLRAKKQIPVFEFMLGLANQDSAQMQAALNTLLIPRNAKITAYDTLPYFDFYLQPQVLLYSKIAAIHGFDLGIDSEIAPKALIDYAPLPEYNDPFDFMKDYDLAAPYEFQNEWIQRYYPQGAVNTTSI